MTGYIYFITNKVTQKSYVGKTIDPIKRKYEHFRRLRLGTHINSKLQNAFDKHGEESFEYRQIEFTYCDEEELNELEIEYIRSTDSYYSGYNLTLGGESGVDISKYHFDFDDYSMVRLGGEKYQGMGNQIAKHYGVSHTMINRIIRGESYLAFQPRFEDLSISERENRIKEFEKIFNVVDSNVNKNLRRKIMSDAERLMALCVLHQNSAMISALTNYFDCSKEVFYRLRKGQTFKHIYDQFMELSEEEKKMHGETHIEKWELHQFASQAGSRARQITDEEMFTFYGGLDIGIQYQSMAKIWGLNVKTVKCWKEKSNRAKTYDKYLALSEDDRILYQEKARAIFLP